MATRLKESNWRVFGERQLGPISHISHSDEQILDFCHCVLCDGDLKQPMGLPCLHRFCRGCLAKLIEVEKQPVFYCPVCYYDVPLTRNGVNDFQEDILVSKLLEVISFKRFEVQGKCVHLEKCNQSLLKKAVSRYCFTCKYLLCEECLVNHLESKAFMTHHLSPMSNSKDKNQELSLTKVEQYSLTVLPKCPTHFDATLYLCCVNCQNSLVCNYCPSNIHEGHQVVDLYTIVMRIKNIIRKNLSLVNEAKIKLTINLDNVKRETQKINHEIARKKHKATEYHGKSIIFIKIEKENNTTLSNAQEQIEKLQKKFRLRLKTLKEKRDNGDEEVNMENHSKLVENTKKGFRAEVKEEKKTRDQCLEYYYQSRQASDEMLRFQLDYISKYKRRTFLVVDEVTERSINIFSRCDNLISTSVVLGAIQDPWTLMLYTPILSNGIQQAVKEIESILTLAEVVTPHIASTDKPLDSLSSSMTCKGPGDTILNKADTTTSLSSSTEAGAVSPLVVQDLVVQDNNHRPTAKVGPFVTGAVVNIPNMVNDTNSITTSKSGPSSSATSTNIPCKAQDTKVDNTAKDAPAKIRGIHLKSDPARVGVKSFRVPGSIANEKWVLTAIASSMSLECAIISGCRDANKTFVSVIDMDGRQCYDKESTSKVSNPNYFCEALSANKIVTVCDPDRLTIVNITTNNVVSKAISGKTPHAERFTCLSVDRRRKRIILGKNSRDLYEFDFALNFCRTIRMVANTACLADVTISADGRIIACDSFGLRAFAMTPGKERVYEFQKPRGKFDNWKPINVCTDSHGYIYILWTRGSCPKVVAKYGKDFKLTSELPVPDNATYIVTSKAADLVRLLIAPKYTGEIFVYDTNF